MFEKPIRLIDHINNIYSFRKYQNSEVIVGNWIDDKDIYRRVIETNLSDNPNNFNELIDVSDWNVDWVVNIFGTFKCLDGFCSTLNTNTVQFGINNNHIIEYHPNSSFNGAKAIIIIDYTKNSVEGE